MPAEVVAEVEAGGERGVDECVMKQSGVEEVK